MARPMGTASRVSAAALLFAFTATACGPNTPTSTASNSSPAEAAAPAQPAGNADDPLPPSELETQLPESVREAVLKPFTGDFDEMVAHKVVRVGVTFNRTFYFVDKGVQRGVVYEYGQLMEQRINEQLKTGNLKVHVFFVPMPREMLLPALVDGKVDIVAAQLTITPEREKLVDFSDATRTNVNEILVTSKRAAPMASPRPSMSNRSSAIGTPLK